MVDEEKLAVDESKRALQHGAVKDEVRKEVHSDIARQARPVGQGDHLETARIADQLKEKAINEVKGAETELERARVAARVSQVVDYVFYVIYSLISLEIILDLLGARDSNAFKQFIDLLSAPFLAPFRTLMPDLSRGRFQLHVSYIVAIFVYLLLHMGVNGLLRMAVRRKTTI
jgi:uncharacterized protein YggT (Ycf19 family)